MSQKPLELILARNLMSALSTPAFLVDEDGLLVFYNEAAGTLLGKGFDEVGHVGRGDWDGVFGPRDAGGKVVTYDELPVVRALRTTQPTHGSFCVRGFDGRMHEVESTAFPLVGAHGTEGALSIFWQVDEVRA
ncbi:MAG: PAS domain-containing protein [Actinobacteria bacterium]|nr:PAS domain-containing protein [Actinomycetota bacterium]